MKIGTHALIWAGGWSKAEAEETISGAAALGYDFVELALADPDAVDVPHTRALLEQHGIGCTCGLGLPADAHLPAAPEAAEAFLGRALEVAAALGAPILTGGVYTHLGARTGAPPRPDELERIGEVLGRVAQRAAALGMQLGIENINRYESYLATTMDQVLGLIDRIGEPNVVAHFDTYHANIEERGFAAPVMAAGERLGYVHISESDRGVIGTANVRFDDVFAALATIGYDGPLVIESFSPRTPEVINAFALWRDPVGDPVHFSRRSLEVVRTMLERHGLSTSATPARADAPH